MKKLAICILSLSLFCCGNDKAEIKETGFEPGNSIPTVTDSMLAANPYSIQMAAFRNYENAFKLRTKFVEMGLDAFIVESVDSDGKIYRAYAGPYASPDIVEQMLPKIQELGYPQAFVKIHEIEFAEVDTTNNLPSVFVDEDKRQITTVGGCTNPQWSPTGREIGFVWQTGGKKGIYTVGTSGGPLSRIVEAGNDFTLTDEFIWSPDGQAIAFIGKEINILGEPVENLFVMSKKQNKPQRLTAQNRFSYKIKKINWSPGGDYIAFEADYGSVESSTENESKVFYKSISEKGYDIYELDRFRGKSTLIGWDSNTSILFFASEDKYEWEQGAGDALKRFNLESAKIDIVSRYMNVAKLTPLALVEKKYIVSYETDGPGLFRLISFNVSSREKFILYELDLHGHEFPEVYFSGSKDLFFTVYDKLWKCTVFKRESVFPLSQPIEQLTSSPSGKRICFSEAGNLFTVRLR